MAASRIDSELGVPRSSICFTRYSRSPRSSKGAWSGFLVNQTFPVSTNSIASSTGSWVSCFAINPFSSSVNRAIRCQVATSFNFGSYPGNAPIVFHLRRQSVNFLGLYDVKSWTIQRHLRSCHQYAPECGSGEQVTLKT